MFPPDEKRKQRRPVFTPPPLPLPSPEAEEEEEAEEEAEEDEEAELTRRVTVGSSPWSSGQSTGCLDPGQWPRNSPDRLFPFRRIQAYSPR